MKKLLKVGVPALITSLVSTVLSCFVLLGDYAYSKKWFETHIEKYDNISNLFMLCSGLVIILIIFSSYIIAKRFMNRKILLTYLLLASLLYIPMMLTLFPLSSNKMYYYTPASELAPSLSIFINQVLSICSAVICAIVISIKLKTLK